MKIEFNGIPPQWLVNVVLAVERLTRCKALADALDRPIAQIVGQAQQVPWFHEKPWTDPRPFELDLTVEDWILMKDALLIAITNDQIKKERFINTILSISVGIGKNLSPPQPAAKPRAFWRRWLSR